MKKIFLMMAVAVLGAASASAQKWTRAFGGGVNYSSFSGNLGDEYDFKPGLQLSYIYDYAFNEKFSVTPELLVLDGGAKRKSGGDISFHYLRIPINATYKFAIKGLRHFVFAGPYIGYGGYSRQDKPDAFGSKADGYMFNPWDFGFNIGVGYQIGREYFRYQYSRGLTNVQYNVQGAKDGGNANFIFTMGHFI